MPGGWDGYVLCVKAEALLRLRVARADDLWLDALGHARQLSSSTITVESGDAPCPFAGRARPRAVA